MRNIFGNERLSNIWSKLHWFFISENYVDIDFERIPFEDKYFDFFYENCLYFILDLDIEFDVQGW